MSSKLIQQLAHQLSPFLPSGTADISARWLIDNRVNLRISRPRKTKLGDFRPAGRGKPHRISVNKDLDPLQFLITFTHEIAHAQTWDKYGSRVAPHGKEWKNCYRGHLEEILALNVLEPEVASAVKRHSQNPKASSSSDCDIQKLTRPEHQGPLLNDLGAGVSFTIDSGKSFKTIRRLRKYWLCEELSSGRHYRVLGSLPVAVHNAEEHNLKVVT
ncbi:SprT-like domain-containing protein [Parendozoicomonas haliclonae]|uniref:Uncharacterized protein n=1 Tax=Parendozoicomonas haliclonae TaxID=1960125 RepID=A0A1X7APZ5_9GAMM|nr:SprT-like domain-containing protein [Parendozoicomonas haliclonae]SMA50315.1 hypothetical protein EHSB41UT_04109 [Parendozoicomonas haliclonae]